MDAAFYRAALPEPFTICNVPLRPFSLGHAILFRRFGITFLDGAEAPTLNDFITALILCACRYEEAIEVFQDPDFDKTFKKWCKSLKQFKLDDPARLESKASLFYDYLREHIDNVPLFAMPEHGMPIDAPFEQVVKVTLMARCHRTETEVLNMPYSLAIWDFLTFKAIDGQITLLDKINETDRRESADKFDALWRKKKGVNGSPS